MRAKMMTGIGRWMYRNHFREYFLVFALKYPKKRFSTKVRTKMPIIVPVRGETSMGKNTLNITGRSSRASTRHKAANEVNEKKTLASRTGLFYSYA